MLNLFQKKFKPDPNKSALENLSLDFSQAFEKGELIWQWDTRHNAVLAEFDAVHQEKVLRLLGTHFSDYWYNSCIADAPSSVRSINEHLGGLKPGQLFFSTDTEKETFTYCAWWPWNLGKTISIRLATAPMYTNNDELSRHSESCKRWFNIEQQNQWGTV